MNEQAVKRLVDAAEAVHLALHAEVNGDEKNKWNTACNMLGSALRCVNPPATNSQDQKRMTKAAKRRRISGESTGCPYCDHDVLDDLNTEWGELGPVEDGSVEQNVRCAKCGRRWQDVFTLTDVHELVG